VNLIRGTLQAVREALDDERGTGRQSKLARLLDWHHSTVWRKLNGKSAITRADERSIRDALLEAEQPKNPSLSRGSCGQLLSGLVGSMSSRPFSVTKS
jgi:hypothetical protein